MLAAKFPAIGLRQVADVRREAVGRRELRAVLRDPLLRAQRVIDDEQFEVRAERQIVERLREERGDRRGRFVRLDRQVDAGAGQRRADLPVDGDEVMLLDREHRQEVRDRAPTHPVSSSRESPSVRTRASGPRRGGPGRKSAGVARLCQRRRGNSPIERAVLPAKVSPSGTPTSSAPRLSRSVVGIAAGQQHQAAPQAERAEGEHRPLGEAEAEDLQRIVEMARRAVDRAWHRVSLPSLAVNARRRRRAR